MQNEPDDHHVLAVAVKSGAQSIVTFNLGDFPADALEPYGIEAYSPDQFLCSLFGHSPETMNRVIEEQAAALTAPPMSVDDVLTRLQAQVPNFVRCI
ncbi:Putative ribonuclease VapC50 [bacterium HR26]|nr:Putative ribonuclease VapC50 [bacterium HR26]